jgi:uncharacterized protein YndB with AHSA1/START domain
MEKLLMIKKILLLLVIAVAGFLGYVAMQPPHYEITRSMVMAAPPAAVFAQVNDFHKWEAWSPWAKLDPNAKTTFEGPESGQGAVLRWTGDKSKVGTGSMTIVESKPNELVRMKLEFVEPPQTPADTAFTLKPQGEGTLVTWNMSGERNYIEKVICTVMNMEKMVGDTYAEGLANIKKIVEAKPEAN